MGFGVRGKGMSGEEYRTHNGILGSWCRYSWLDFPRGQIIFYWKLGGLSDLWVRAACRGEEGAPQ